MLSSIWQNVVGDKDVDPSQVLKDDTTLYSTEDEDELADKLLTQFPAYGSAEPTRQDWLIDDTTNDNNNKEEDSVLLLEESVLAAGGTSTATRGGTTLPSAAKTKQDWDEEEQALWKGTSTSAASSASESQATVKRTTPISLKGVSFYSLNKNNENALDGRAASNQLAVASSALMMQQQQNDDRQHWMPDKLCKQCYACELPFTGMNFYV